MRRAVSNTSEGAHSNTRQDIFLDEAQRIDQVLDIGCGNTPTRIKQARSDIYYVGLDVDQGLDSFIGAADEYIVASPEGFPEQIEYF